MSAAGSGSVTIVWIVNLYYRRCVSEFWVPTNGAHSVTVLRREILCEIEQIFYGDFTKVTGVLWRGSGQGPRCRFTRGTSPSMKDGKHQRMNSAQGSWMNIKIRHECGSCELKLCSSIFNWESGALGQPSLTPRCFIHHDNVPAFVAMRIIVVLRLKISTFKNY